MSYANIEVGSGSIDRDRSPRRIRTPDGLDLVADDVGARDAPAVILLHGGGQTRHSWSGAMRALGARGYRVINFDARGHGDSDWSPAGEYELDHRVSDLRAIVAGLDRPFALVGASLGGATAIHAVANGIDAAALIVVDIVPEPEPEGIARIIAFMRRHPEGFATIDAAADAVAAYNPERPRSSDASGLMKNLRRRADDRLYWHWDPLIAASEPGEHHLTVQRSAATLAREGRSPVLLVRGMKSDVVSDAGVAAFRAMLPALEVADVGGAGHMVAGDRNDAFNESVIGFLVRHLPLGVDA